MAGTQGVIKKFWYVPKIVLNFVSHHSHQRYISTCRTLFNEAEILHYLQRKKIGYKNGPTCFLCKNVIEHETNKDTNRSLTCYINKTNGHYLCTDTELSGSWDNFKLLHSLLEAKRWQKYNELLAETTQAQENLENSVSLDWKLSTKSLFDVEHSQVQHLLQIKGLSIFKLDFLNKSQIKVDETETKILFPWLKWKHYDQISVVGIEAIIDNPKQDHSVKPSLSQMQDYYQSSYYGALGVGPSFENKVLVLTPNVLDTLAINSASLKYHAICLPFGTSHLPLNALPLLERFTKIVIWFQNSLSDIEAANIFAKKLGVDRCRLVKTRKFSSAFQALLQGYNIDQILERATSLQIPSIIKFEDIEGEVKNEIENNRLFVGVPWKRFKNLTKKLKGHRRGELTIVTGTTGCGKTTWLSEMSLDLAMQGVTTLWGSFEINNTRLMKCMFRQFSQLQLEQNIDKFDEISEEFKKLPLYMMTFNGPQKIAMVLETMRQATYAKDIRHVIIDNLQFMLGNMNRMDIFSVQDQVVEEFRKFATMEQVHVTVVIHPRKEDSNLPLQISSVFGSGKATQEADNVLILQCAKLENNMTRKYLEVCKNRFDGDVGSVALYFDKNTLCMSKPENDLVSPNTMTTLSKSKWQ